ncbi:MAG: hypothetical protein V4534_04270 [Myxococcota bacterium]
MATARDTLLQELLQLLGAPHTERSESILLSVLDRFRIQSKSGPDNKKGTARELILSQLHELWENAAKEELSHGIGQVIHQYRMQLKQGGEKKNESKEKAKVVSTKVLPVKQKVEPLAGGPQKRQRVRGECPKCHSMGVVLARSYSGDEYFSCIYCGYQSHRAAMDLEFDLPLAAELLNRRFDDKDGSQGH